MTTSHGILGLYFYRAKCPVLGAEMDLNDSSCRPDPDFDFGTLGLCRPGLRTKVARLANNFDPVDLLFYTYSDNNSFIRLVALMRVEEIFPDHLSARSSFSPVVPPNLMIAGNQCLCGTSLDAQARKLRPLKLPRNCSCDRYISRANSVYIRFCRQTAMVRRDRPVTIALQDLARLAPNGIGSRWPQEFDVGSFNRGVQNGAHWLRQPAEADAVRTHFLEGGVLGAPHAGTRGKRTRAHASPAGGAPKAPATGPTRRSGRKDSC